MRYGWLVAGILLWSGLQAGVLSPDLEEALKTAQHPLPVYAVLVEQVDPKSLVAETRNLSKKEARRHVIQVLKTVARESQRDLLRYLHTQEQLGKASRIQPLWITNVVAFEATPEVIQAVAQRPDVALVKYDPPRPVLLEGTPPKAAPTVVDQVRTLATGTRSIAWGVSQINAPAVWDQGITGQGVVVGILDTGVNYNHVDLADHVWTNPGEIPGNGIDDDGNGYVDDIHGYDFFNNDGDPMDDQGHGTHCAGSVAGDGTAGTQTGVAPDAQIMALKILNASGGGSEAGAWNGVQYALDNGADVLSASIGWCHRYNPNRQQWRQVADNVLAAGVVWVAAAGNEGNLSDPYNSCPDAAPDNVDTPGDIPSPWKHPDQASNGSNGTQSSVITVGATDSNDNIASFSSRGGVTWVGVSGYNDYPYVGPTGKKGLIKPDVSAPGVNITSLDYSTNNGYTIKSGTSMATPHVAGVVALMLSKNPNITPVDVDSILEITSIDLGITGKDTAYGTGRVDALAAVNAVPNPPYTHDVFVNEILAPSDTLTVTSTSPYTVTPRVEVANNDTTIETFDVHLVMATPNGQRIYSAVATVSNLAPGDTVQVTFPSHTFYYTDPASMYFDTAWTSLAGDENPANDRKARTFTVYRQGTQYLIVDVDPDHSSGPEIDHQLQYWGWAGEYTTNFPSLSTLQNYQSVWICLGIFNNNYALDSTEANTIVDYLHSGGNVYMEGGDAWAYDPQRSVYDPYFGIDPNNSDDGSSDLNALEGVNNSYLPWVEGHTWTYTGKKKYIDRMVLHSSPPDNGAPEVYLRNPSTNANHGVINQGTYNTLTYHTVAHAFELGNLTQTGRGAVAETLAAYILRGPFGIAPTAVQEAPPMDRPTLKLRVAPVLTRDRAQVVFTLPTAGRVTVDLYDAAGRRVQRLFEGAVEAGTHRVSVAAEDLVPGVYLVRLTTARGTAATQRLVVIH